MEFIYIKILLFKISKKNIFFTLEELQENDFTIGEDGDEIIKDSIPCFCQGEAICVFCMKEKDLDTDKEKDTTNFDYQVFENQDFSQFQSDIDDEIFSKKVNYNVNFTVKQLSMICDYYGILKGMKGKNKNKNDLIEAIVSFENDSSNSIIVLRRKKLWFYLEELKRDSFLKKFIWL